MTKNLKSKSLIIIDISFKPFSAIKLIPVLQWTIVIAIEALKNTLPLKNQNHWKTMNFNLRLATGNFKLETRNGNSKMKAKPKTSDLKIALNKPKTQNSLVSRSEKREARSEKREARSEKREARSEKRGARSEEREARFKLGYKLYSNRKFKKVWESWKNPYFLPENLTFYKLSLTFLNFRLLYGWNIRVNTVQEEKFVEISRNSFFPLISQ